MKNRNRSRNLQIVADSKKQTIYEEELRRLHMAINQAPDAIFITDPEGGIVYANPALEGISGYSLTELLGQNPRIFKSDRQDLAFYRVIWDTLKKGETWRGPFINMRKDGRYWEAESSIAPVLDSEGRLVNYVCTQRDVTHERLLQSQLEESQRLEAIGVLAAGLAHDLNNILFPILAHAEMGLNREGASPALRKDLEVILLSAQRAGNLTKQVLSFSRNEAMEVHSIELHRVVMESLKLLRAAIPSSIRFQIASDPASGFVKGDPSRLHQIMLNLCSNAAHSMRGGSGTLKISLHKENLLETQCVTGRLLPKGDYVVLEVSDTGRGMDSETLSRIFLPFFTTKGPEEGTGLGLSNVLGVVQSMNGGIQVESEPGAGTTFRLFLPLVPAITTPIVDIARPLPPGNERILLVDDDAMVLATLESMLSNLGYQVVAMANPQQALERFQADPAAFNLLLTDLTMPGMTGHDLIAKVRSLQPGMHALLMTGVLDMEEANEHGTSRPDGILTKPFSNHAVAGMIRMVLNR